MSTLREIAAQNAAKKKPLSKPANGGMLLTHGEPVDFSGLLQPVTTPNPLDVGPRELGAEVSGETFPMDWTDRQWTEALHTPETQAGIVLSADGKSAWLAIVPVGPNGRRPLLLHRWPVFGRLAPEAGGQAQLCANSQSNCASLPASASDAGQNGAAPSGPAVAFAPGMSV